MTPRILNGWLAILLLVAGNLSVQFAWERKGLDNGIDNHSRPSSTDSRDYVRRAALVAGGPEAFPERFSEAFRDGYRLPGYPLFLAAFHPFFKAPLQAARYAQLLLSAGVILLGGLALRGLLGPSARAWRSAVGGAALIALWGPLYYFSPVLLAESCSLFALGALLCAMSRPAGPLSPLFCGLLLALLVYLKPNHILLLLPVAAFLWMQGFPSRKRGAWRAGACVLVVLASLAPWSAFLSRQQGKPVWLSTASGVNLYLGTGALQFPADAGTLPYRFAMKTIGVQADSLARSASLAPDSIAADEARFAAEARAIRRAHPARTAAYGVLKILHGFGFSLRGPRDVALALFFVASLLASGRVWRNRTLRPWAVFFWGVLFVTALQMFLYLPNQRFKTVLFDLPALLILALGTFGTPRARAPDPGAGEGGERVPSGHSSVKDES